jgi:hypothetical protein
MESGDEDKEQRRDKGRAGSGACAAETRNDQRDANQASEQRHREGTSKCPRASLFRNLRTIRVHRAKNKRQQEAVGRGQLRDVPENANRETMAPGAKMATWDVRRAA